MARKVVINACFGGFRLSDAAYERLIALGIPVRKYVKQELGPDGRYSQPPENTGEIIFDRELTPPGEDEMNDKMYHAFKGTDSRIFGNRYWDSWTDRNREHPLLIQVVEEMGAAANGVCAGLKIVEIPDDVEYTIEEYDGNEHLAEAHQTWA